MFANVFEKFRDKCLAIDKLDPAYYLSAPAFSWHSGLKMTGQTLELLTDENMLLLFEKGIRGGICNAICKYAKANKKYMKNYDSSKKSTYLMYVDANNLYGYAMCKKLPTGNFKWVEDLSIFTKDFIKNYSEDSNTGYLLVVDVKYPENLYRDHKYLPFLPDKTKINKVKKLTYDSHDKKEYSIYISVLKQALNHGLKLKKIHSAISFSQDNWLEPYIMHNTNLRMKAANDFEKDYYKLLNNSFYGKTMENVRGHRDIKLVTNNKKRSVLKSEPNYHGTKHISEELSIMEMKLRELYMNKTLYLGQVILDNSKMLMYEYWYDYLRPMYGDKIKLCYMDTDSFIIYVETEDFYKDISNDIDKWFGTSNFSKDINRPLEKGKNEKVIGKFKDELGGLIMSEFCALRSKAYAFLIDGFNDIDYEKHDINKKAKGTKKCVIKNKITFNDYVNALFNSVKVTRSQFTFRSRFHEIYTEKINKIALSSNDDKRIQCNDKIATYPYGYYDIGKNIIDTSVNTKIIDITSVDNVIDNIACKYIKIINDINVNTKNTNDIPENTNANSEIELIKKEARTIRERSKLLREESQTIRNSSNNARNELKIIRKEAQNIKKDSYDINDSSVNKARKRIEEGQAIRNNFKVLREESQAIRNNCNVLIEKGRGMRNNFNDIRNNARELIEEAQAIKKRSEGICET